MQTLKDFLKKNKIPFIYIAFAAVLEAVSSFFVGARPWFTRFWIPLLLFSVLILSLLFAKSLRKKRIVSFIMLFVQVATILASGYLYEANGSAFQKEMLYQRNDAFGKIEQFNVNIFLIIICLGAIVGFFFILRGEGRRLLALAEAGKAQLAGKAQQAEEGSAFQNKSAQKVIMTEAAATLTPAEGNTGANTANFSANYNIKNASPSASRTASHHSNIFGENDTTVNIYVAPKPKIKTKTRGEKLTKAQKKARRKEMRLRYSAANKKVSVEGKHQKIIRLAALSLCVVCTALFCISPVMDGATEKKYTDYYYKLTSSENGNQKYGITSNVVYELLSFGSSIGINTDDLGNVDDFIYGGGLSPASDFHGISEGNNLLFILAESFDTHVLERYSRQDTAKIFPNITRIMDEGLYFDSYYQKEKTDVSEAFSLLGSYPTEKYINYNYANNDYSYSLPNLFRESAMESGKTEDELQLLSFHQNQGEFYNRNKLHESFGFEEFVDINDMEKEGVRNDWDLWGNIIKGERTLDSMTIEKMKDLMLPEDKQFFSYWISFTMHGFYKDRENLAAEGYYDILDNTFTEDGQTFFPTGSKNDNYWRTYAAGVIDFDRALGTILDDLQQKGILDSTTIVIMPDHDTYYNGLSKYATEFLTGEKITSSIDPRPLRLPLMIYDTKLAHAYAAAEGVNSAAGERCVVDKFVTGSDVMPTICDLFGIPIWNNMYLGCTAFVEQETIIYSRIYNFFGNDRLAFFNIENIDYIDPTLSGDQLAAELELFEQRAKTLLDKVYFMDKVYYSDYFADPAHPYRSPQ